MNLNGKPTDKRTKDKLWSQIRSLAFILSVCCMIYFSARISYNLWQLEQELVSLKDIAIDNSKFLVGLISFGFTSLLLKRS